VYRFCLSFYDFSIVFGIIIKLNTDKRHRKPKRQIRMGNPETSVTLSTRQRMKTNKKTHTFNMNLVK
jgi:hypothetical protein